MVFWGLGSLQISTSFEVFFELFNWLDSTWVKFSSKLYFFLLPRVFQQLPCWNCMDNFFPQSGWFNLTSCCSRSWLTEFISVGRGMQIPGKCKRLGDKSYKNRFKLPPGMWRWGTREVVPAMTENSGFYQCHSTNSTPTEEAIGRTSWIPKIIPKGEKLNSAKNIQKEHYFSEIFLNPKLSGKVPLVPFLEEWNPWEHRTGSQSPASPDLHQDRAAQHQDRHKLL